MGVFLFFGAVMATLAATTLLWRGTEARSALATSTIQAQEKLFRFGEDAVGKPRVGVLMRKGICDVTRKSNPYRPYCNTPN